MKNILLSLALLPLAIFAKKENGIVNNQGKPTKAFLHFLKAAKIKNNGTLGNILSNVQYWIQPTERATEHRNELRESLDKLGCIGAVPPKHSSYKTIVIIGGSFHEMLDRILFCWTLFERSHLTAHNFIILTSYRKLNPVTENQEELKKTYRKYKHVLPFKSENPWDRPYTTEAELANMLADRLNFPKKFSSQTIHIPTPVHINQLASMGELTLCFVKQAQNLGKTLFVCSNPYLGYHEAVLRRVSLQTKKMLKLASFEVVGIAADEHTPLNVYFDAIARWVFEEFLRIKLQKQS